MVSSAAYARKRGTQSLESGSIVCAATGSTSRVREAVHAGGKGAMHAVLEAKARKQGMGLTERRAGGEGRGGVHLGGRLAQRADEVREAVGRIRRVAPGGGAQRLRASARLGEAAQGNTREEDDHKPQQHVHECGGASRSMQSVPCGI